MKAFKPFVIDNTRLNSSSIPEPDASMGEVDWVSGQAYTAGFVVIRVQTHRKYIALVNVTSTTPPENDPTRWKDIGPTNRFAAFDYKRSDASTASGSISFVLTPIQRVTALALFGLQGNSVNIKQRSSLGGPILNEWTFNLQTRFVTTWYQYLIAPFEFRKTVVIDNINPASNSVFEITISAPTGFVSVKYAAVGMSIFIGHIEYGAGSDILDFSTIERDEFGGVNLVPRKNVPTLGGTLFVEKSRIPQIFQFREQSQATPLVFLGLSKTDDEYFEPLSGIGIIRSMPILIEYPNHSLINLEVEGL